MGVKKSDRAGKNGHSLPKKGLVEKIPEKSSVVTKAKPQAAAKPAPAASAAKSKSNGATNGSGNGKAVAMAAKAAPADKEKEKTKSKTNGHAATKPSRKSQEVEAPREAG